MALNCSVLIISQKPGSNARAKIPISDGEVSVLAILSDTAWDAYDKGLEEGEEARKGDLLLCKKLTVVSTTYGPIDERIKLRIEDLELTGNFRKVIGQPAPLLERTSIIASREKIENLRLKQLQSEIPAEDDQEDVSAEDDEEMEDEPEDGASDDEQTGDNTVEVSADTANAPHDPVPAKATHSERPMERPSIVSRMSPPNRTSPATLNTASAQIESQLPLNTTPTQPTPQPRNPVRRTRGGFSMGREGFEPTRGDNLTGPQAPTLHARHARLSPEPPKNKLLDVISKLPGQLPKKRSPEPSAPVSAQVVPEDIVVETPTKVKRVSETSKAQDSTPAPRKRYRIPRDQRALLDNSSSWIPSAPGHQFPHPNVPIALLAAWNAKATGATNSPSQSSPIPMVEQSPRAKSIEEVQPEPQVMAAAELEDESDDSESSDGEPNSDDEPIPWSQSPSRSQVLPPDSSAAHMSPRSNRPGSRDLVMSGSEHMPISIADDGRSTASSEHISIAGSGNGHRELPQWKHTLASQTPTNSGRVSTPPIPSQKTPTNNNNPAREALPRALSSTQRQAGTNSEQKSERVSHVPSSSLRTPALPVSTRSPAAPRSRPSLQPYSMGPQRSQPLADNHQSPIRSSTQQTPDHRRRSFDPKEHVLPSDSPATRLGAPTGPRSSMGSQYGTYDRRNHNVDSAREPARSGDYYRPSPSRQRGGATPSGSNTTNRRRPEGTQTPAGTIEMESAVPRALPPNEYHQKRSNYFRDVQRRQW